MNIKENVTLSLEYFKFIKNISSSFLDYIKQYQFISVEYHQKLLLLNTTFKGNISDLFDKIAKAKLDFSNIFDFVNTIPKIMESHLESLLFFTEEITKQISLLEDKTIDQIISTCESQFNDFKKNLANKSEEIFNTKNNFLTEMEKTEITIYSYYFLNPKFNLNIPEKYKNDSVKEEEMDKKILDTKKIENKYKEQINEGNNQEKKFLENSKFHSENIKKFTNELMEKIKKFILNFLMALKNIFKLPEIEINNYLPKLIKLNENIKLDEIIQKHFIKQNIANYLFNPEIYQMKIFQKNNHKKENKELIDEIENKILELEDGLETTYLIVDEISLFTIQKMKKFELINIKDLNLEKEREKLKMNQLTIKLLSNIKKEPNEVDENQLNITQQDLDLIELLLNNHHNRIIFMQKLSKFRVLGYYYISKTIYTILSKYFLQIINTLKEDPDMFTAKNIIVLSQTYFIKEKDKKIYLQEAIKSHEIFKKKEFWENLFNFFMNKEILKLRKSIDLNEIIEEGKNNYSKLAFGQIMTICNNMIEFGINKDEIYQIIEPKIKYYNLDENSIEGIKCVLGFNEGNIDNQ